MDFQVGVPLSAPERAAVLVEAREQAQAQPAEVAKLTKSAATFLGNVKKMSELEKTQARERILQYIVFGTNKVLDSHRSDAIVLAHDPILAKANASHGVLTRSALTGILNQMDQIAIYQGRQVLPNAVKAQFAATLPQSFQQAAAADQLNMAAGASRALRLRTALASLSPASHAAYQKTAGVGAVTPQMLQMAASKTVDINSASGRSFDSLIKENQRNLALEFYWGNSYLIPHH